jgi:YbgC/YbaW family acyl-CoA thioester hydrolase
VKRNPFRHVERLRVRGAEVGLHDTVFGSHHLAYFDAAMAGYWRAMAVPCRQAVAQLGGELILRKATLEFLSAARRDDLLDVGLRCSQAGESSLVFDAAVFRGDCALVEAQLTYVFADPAAQAPPTTQPAPRCLAHAAARLRGRRADDRAAHRRLERARRRRAAHSPQRVHRRARHPGGSRVGRRRCRLHPRGGLQPPRRRGGHRALARARAGRRTHRPHGAASATVPAGCSGSSL